MHRYYKRDLAVAYSIKHDVLPVWAEDIHPKNGSQRFLAVSYDKFQDLIQHIPNSKRNFYELLRPDSPTHLYLDIEYEKVCNPGLSGVSTRIDNIVRRGLTVLYKLKLKDVDLIELDASNGIKYSRHLIYRIRDGRMFKNPFHCGAFLRRLSFPKANLSDGTKTEIVDPSVYTSWRAFRCAGSSKMRAPDRPLIPYSPRNIHFLDTLVQRPYNDKGSDSHLEMLLCPERDGTEPISGNGPKKRKRSRDKETDGLDERDILESTNSSSLSEDFFKKLGREIETFWHDGTVTYERYDHKTQTVFFSSDSKWCGLKGGEHEGNHVYFMADLGKGSWRQGCYSKKRKSCYTVDRLTGEGSNQWGNWNDLAHADDIRDFMRESVTLREEYIKLVRDIEQRLN